MTRRQYLDVESRSISTSGTEVEVLTRQFLTDWQPRPKQQAVLETAMAAGLNRTISAVCREAGVSRQSLYTWLDSDSDFRLAWYDVWRSSIRRHLPGVVSAVIAKALDGNVPAARLVADMAGVLKQRTELSGPGGDSLSFAQIMDWAEEQEGLETPNGGRL